jgi:hypothetical protein
MLSEGTTNQLIASRSKIVTNIDYKIQLKPGEIPYYAKASRKSEQKRIIPEELLALDIDYAIRGLVSRDRFWYFWNVQMSEPRYLMFGFIEDSGL